MRAMIFVAVVLAVSLQACSEPYGGDDYDTTQVETEERHASQYENDELDTASEVDPSTNYYTPYQDAGSPYGCTEDCSGHEAGYQWAEDNGIEGPDDCGGRSNSFIEGCMTYAEEYQEQAKENEEDRYW